MMKPSFMTGWLAMFVSLANVWPVTAQDVTGPRLSLVQNVSPSLCLSLTNAGGGNYSIQRSTNLASWAAAHTLILSATNSGSLNVTNDRPTAFYRAVAMPSVSQGRATTVVTSRQRQ